MNAHPPARASPRGDPLRPFLAAAAALLLLTTLAPHALAGSAELAPCPGASDKGTRVIVNGSFTVQACCGVSVFPTGSYCRTLLP